MNCRNCATRDDDGKITQMGHHDTVAEARACKGVPDPRQTSRQQTFLKNGIKEAQLLPEHFTKDGLAHVAQVLGLPATGTKDDLAGRIREVL